MLLDWKARYLGTCCKLSSCLMWLERWANEEQYDGQQGVEKALDILYNEFRRCMMLTGCNSVADISKAKIGIARPDGPLARL